MLTLIIVELILIFTVPLVIKDIRSKSNEIFLGVTTRNHHKLGWIAYNGRPRPSTNYAVRNSTKDPCVYVFGDSFSHADEVNHVDAWPNQLEKKLGCKVINHGVNAYGTDQAYLLLADVLPNRDQSSGLKPIVLFGVYQEMLRRNNSGSLLFYCCSGRKNSLRPYFSINKDRSDIELNEIPSKLNLQNIKNHHNKDRYYKLFNIEFPYLISTIRNLYYRINKKAFNYLALEPREIVWNDKDSKFIQIKLMEKVRNLALKRGYQVAFVYFPTPQEATKKLPFYKDFIISLPQNLKKEKDLILINTHSELHKKTKIYGELKAPQGHFNKKGNLFIAELIFDSIKNR